MCNVVAILVQRHLPIMCYIHISQILVTLLILLGSYKAYIVTYLSRVHLLFGIYGMYVVSEGYISV